MVLAHAYAPHIVCVIMSGQSFTNEISSSQSTAKPEGAQSQVLFVLAPTMSAPQNNNLAAAFPLLPKPQMVKGNDANRMRCIRTSERHNAREVRYLLRGQFCSVGEEAAELTDTHARQLHVLQGTKMLKSCAIKRLAAGGGKRFSVFAV